MLIFLAANQAIISNQSSKNIVTLANTDTNNAPAAEGVPIDNDRRGVHSYFLPPRIFSARYPVNGTIAVRQPKENPVNPATNRVQALPMSANAQDLLHAGYLRDNEGVYVPDFGASRKD
jgi:hypothetical protein